MNDLFEKERTKQRILIKLDETRIIMDASAQRLLERGNILNENVDLSESLVESSRRMYWKSLPWYKRWFYCCFS